MKQVVRTTIVAIVLISVSVPVAVAQPFDPAAIETTVARLNLTEEQKTKARPIIEAGIRERMQIMKDAGIERGKKPRLRQLMQVREPIKESRARTEAQLSGIFTPEQMSEYRKIVEERRQRTRANYR